MDKLKEQLAAVPQLIERWFASFPHCDEEAKKVDDIALWDRSHSGKIRKATFEGRDGTLIQAESIHFASSPEVWVVRTVEDLPGVPRYTVFSWYGMHMPSVHSVSSQGELIDGTATNQSHPIQDALAGIAACRSAIHRSEIEVKIARAPEFRNDGILVFLEAHAGELGVNVGSRIRGLPRKVIEAQLEGDAEVSLGGTGPYNRKDLSFYSGDALNMTAVRAACPELMQVHDILSLHGFSPTLHAELSSAPGSRIPFLSLTVRTEEALELVKT